MLTLRPLFRSSFRSSWPALLLMLALACLDGSATIAAELAPFTSDGCSLFPDGTLNNRTQWCGCCLDHDLAYWQGGTAAERSRADQALRDCVLARTQDPGLAETMYLGVRAGGHPAFPTWYRWGYGWPYGRGYQALSQTENQQVRQHLGHYAQEHPGGYCGEQETKSAAAPLLPHRPATWAAAVPSQHLSNFYQLDAKVYRSAQPSQQGFEELQLLGIKNILNFRHYHSDDAGGIFGFHLYRIKMDAGDITTEQVVEALRIIKGAEGPILIHCWHGSDRTGLIAAMYRIVVQGWSKDAAIDELQHGEYGYHALYQNIPEFIRQAEIEAIRKQVGD